MSLTDDLAALAAAGNGFSTAFQAAVVKKVEATKQADTALLLDNKDNAQFGVAMDTELTAHAQSDGHTHVQPADIDVYTRAQIDALVSSKMQYSDLDISQVGDLSYLSLGIESRFEGASNPMAYRYYAVNLEDDGTLVYLRNGSNGSKYGVYYAYVSNALQSALTAPVRTNRRYQPSYFPAGYTARNVFKSDGKVIAGQLQDALNNPAGYFVSITNGTFDDTNHQGFIIPASWGVVEGGYSHFEFVLGPLNAVYIIQALDLANNAAPLDFKIYRVLSGWGSGSSQTPTDMGGFSTTSLGGANYAPGDRLRLANKIISATPGDGSLFLINSYTGSYSFSVMSSSGSPCTTSAFKQGANLMRMRVTMDNYVLDQVNGNTARPWLCMSFVLDMVNKTATLDDPSLATQAVVNIAAGGITTSGGIIQTAKGLTMPSTTLNSFDSTFYQRTGDVVGINDQNLTDVPCFVSRAKLSNTYSAVYDWLRWNANVSNASTASFMPEYGSAIGGSLCGTQALGSSYGLIKAQGRNLSGAFYAGLVHFQYGAEDATYTSLQNGHYTGFELTPYRQFVKDLGLDETKYWSTVTEIGLSGSPFNHGAYFVQNYNDIGLESFDAATLTPSSNNVTLDPQLWSSLTAAAVTALGFTAANVKASRCSIVIPRNASVPPWMSMTIVTTAGQEHNALLSLSIPGNVRTGAITSLSIVSVIVNANTNNLVADISDFTPMIQAGVGISILETADAWLVGGTEKHQSNRSGWSGGWSYRFAVPKSTGTPETSSTVVTPTAIVYDGQFYGAVPGKGFGYFDQTNNTSDGYTKSVFIPVATDLASYRSWAVPAQSSYRVLTGQDVAQGWTVYFTKRNPTLLSGVGGVIPATQIDLSAVIADPSNKTFWVYVETDGTTLSYKIYTSSQPETRRRIYIAQVVTGATQITSITSEKPIRLGQYRVSPTSRGSAIAVTTGTPDAANSLSWT